MHKNYIFTKNIFKKKTGDESMIKKIAWNTFKNTGDINTFLEFRKFQDIEEYMKVENYENSQNQRNNNC